MQGRTFIFYILLLSVILSMFCFVEMERGSRQTLSIYSQFEESNFRLEMQRGINIGNALEAPNEGDWGVYIRDEYFSIIKEAGFCTVRIPIRWSNHAENYPPYKIEDNFFTRVDWVVNESLEQNLFTIINMHNYDEIMQSPAEQKDRFLELWRQISEHYRDFPETLCFELLNEPHGALTDSIWNDLIDETVKIIRKTNPTRKIIVGPTGWNSVYNLNGLTIPADDKNIIVTFHFYTPFEFTHQGAEWVSPSPPVGRRWMGNESEQRQITNELDIAVQWATQHDNISIFLGEFGAYSKADMNSRVIWTYFVAREAERRSIFWCYWEFCSGFGAYDPVKNEWREDLLNALIPKVSKYYVSVDTEYGSSFGSGWYDEGSYAPAGVNETTLGFLVQDVFDHFEGLGPGDKLIDPRAVEVYVDGPREIKAIWRRDYSRLLFVAVTTCAGVCLGVFLYIRRKKFDRSKSYGRRNPSSLDFYNYKSPVTFTFNP